MKEKNNTNKDSNKETKIKRKAKKQTNPVIRKLRIEFITVMMAIVVLFLLVIFGIQYISSIRTMESDSEAVLTRALGNITNFPIMDDPFPPVNPEDIGVPGTTGNSGEEDPDVPSMPWENNEGENGQENDQDDKSDNDQGDLKEKNKDSLTGKEKDDKNENGRENTPGKRTDEFRYRDAIADYRISNFTDRQDRVAILLALYRADGTVDTLRNNIFFINTEDVSGLVVSAVAKAEDQGMIDNYDLRYRKQELRDGTVAVAFADISNERSLLRQQLVRSVWISLVVVIAMFLLSLWLSRLTIRPVERAWDDQKRFVADASHELKTPLTVIMSNTDMVTRSLGKLLESEEKADTREVSESKLQRNLHRMENVREESLRMKELIGELLEVARGDVGQHVENFQDLSLSELTEDTLLSWESVYFEAGKTLSSSVEEELTIHGDRTLLRRLLEILIDNALKYSSEGSEVFVQLKKEKQHGSRKLLHLSVTNKGTPLTEEEILHLFDRFYRADSSREVTSGYGLGLSIAESIVTAHKGRIRAEATSDGNRFHVTFPC